MSLAQAPLNRLPSANELLVTISHPSFTGAEHNSLLLISFEGLPEIEDDQFWTDAVNIFAAFKKRFSAQMYRITGREYGALVKVTELNQININTSLKYEILKLIQSHFPEFFGLVDQSRLVRVISLTTRKANAVSYLEYRVKESIKSEDGANKLRPIRESDIERVLKVKDHVGAQDFAKLFLNSQPISIVRPNQPVTPVMNEYFVALDALRKHAFPDVELRGAGNLFAQLTLTLDTILLGIFNSVVPGGTRATLNLNVESVFTKSFEQFCNQRGDAALTNLVFEFRQVNILQHFDQFDVAASLIRERGGVVAVDAIFPETLGIVNIGRLGAEMAKVFWRPGAEAIIPDMADDIAAMQESGCMIIMSRVDEDTAVEIGHPLGITMYQGFYVDDLIKHNADGTAVGG
ncbi:MAG: hypothetical protein RIC16_02485 [Rhodospirillales bacterium]